MSHVHFLQGSSPNRSQAIFVLLKYEMCTTPADGITTRLPVKLCDLETRKNKKDTCKKLPDQFERKVLFGVAGRLTGTKSENITFFCGSYAAHK